MNTTIEDSASYAEQFPSTGADEQARRICSLAVAFSCATHPLTSAEVHAAFYPGLSESAFSRAFRRDRTQLATCGIPTWPADGGGGRRGWVADTSSFADGEALRADDALLLCALCQQLVDDEAFPHRFELRHALAKVARGYQGMGAIRLSAANRESSPILACLLRCLAEHRLARIDYTDAAGHPSRRVVAPYGSFGLNGATYFVCGDEDGMEDVRTFRIDRISSATALERNFEMPGDFRVDDYIVLPFQIGPTVSEASFLVPPDSEGAVMLRSHRHEGGFARHDEPAPGDAGDGAIWTVPMSDRDVAASWAIAMGVKPLFPVELVRAWRAALSAAGRVRRADIAPFGSITSRRAATARGRQAGRGRRSGLDEARELIALASSLGYEGDTLTVDAVSARLGIARERAAALLDLLLMVGGEDVYLPLSVSDDERSVTLVFGGGFHGRPVRLTGPETQALIAALDTTGVRDDDPLRRSVLAAFSSPSISEEEVRHSIAASTDPTVASTLATCAHALIDVVRLGFSYKGMSDEAPHRRHVVPIRLEHHDGHWYLVARDLDRAAERSFRISRMSEVSAAAPQDDIDMRGADDIAEPRSTARQVTIVFANERHLVTLGWPGLQVTSRDPVNEVTTAQTLWYGGSWLPRHLAACAGEAATSDAELTAAVRKVARDALERVRGAP